MKTFFLIALLLLSVILANQCIKKNEEPQNQSTNGNVLDNENSFAPPLSNTNLQTQKVKRPDKGDFSQRLIKSQAELSNIINLKDTPLPNGESEIRILVGGGIGYPRWFILSNQKGQLKSFNVKPVSVKGKVIMQRIELGNPNSGWKKFNNYLEQQGIKVPLDLSLDSNFDFYPDGEAVIVEVKSGDDYDVVYYSDITSSNDGQKVINVCRKIKEEFNIDLISQWTLDRKK